MAEGRDDRKPVGREIDGALAHMDRRLAELEPMALATLEELMNSDNPKIRLESAIALRKLSRDMERRRKRGSDGTASS